MKKKSIGMYFDISKYIRGREVSDEKLEEYAMFNGASIDKVVPSLQDFCVCGVVLEGGSTKNRSPRDIVVVSVREFKAAAVGWSWHTENLTESLDGHFETSLIKISRTHAVRNTLYLKSHLRGEFLEEAIIIDFSKCSEWNEIPETLFPKKVSSELKFEEVDFL